MKPLPSHPPLSTRRSRGRGEGGVGRSSSKELGGGGDSSLDTSTARWTAPDTDRGPNPTWMKKLEERYQKLHHKIASIPSYNSTASRFNFLTRKILNERLARAHKNGHHHADAAAVAGEGEGGRNTNTAPDIATTTTASLTGKCVNRNPSTAPNVVSYNDTPVQTEEFVSLATSNNNNDDDDYDDSDDLDDENFPPAAGRTAERAAVTVLNGESAAGLARPLPRCLCSSHSHCQTDPAMSEYPSLPPCPLHSGGGRGGGGGGGGGGYSGAGRGRSGESVETLDDQVLQARRGSPLSKRDEALEANNNSAADLAEPAGLAHVSHGRPTSLPLHGTGDHPQPGISSRAGRLTSASQGLRHGHEDSTGTGAGRDNNAGESDVEGKEGGGGRGGGGGGGGGVANSDWVGWDMGEASARGVKSLNPITNRATGKQGGYMLRTAQTGVSHHSHATTTKSCPAVLNSNDLPTPARRAGGGRQEAGAGGRNGGHDMRFFAQMSVEARHAVTETLREMEGAGERRDSEDWLEGDGEGEEDDDEDYAEEEEVNNGDDDDDYNNGNSNVSLPSLTDPHSTFTTQHHHQHHQQRRSKQHNDTTTSTQQQQQNREDSMVTWSHRTSTTQQRSLRGSRQGADVTSSVNATVKGARSPRRTSRKPRSTHANVVNKRGRPRSGKGRGTTHVDVPSNDNERGGDMDLDLISMASTGNASSNRSSPVDRHEAKLRMHLPAITSRTDPNVTPPARKDSIRHVNYRIRGVGSYRVARETTFEITAPDFDIRYRDVITCQKGDRDTPPPDIFEKSVGKVRDWLNKYYFHNS